MNEALMVQERYTGILPADLAFLDQLAEGICLVDGTHTVFGVNSALTQILVQPAYALLGQKVDDLFGGDTQADGTPSLSLLLSDLTAQGFSPISAHEIPYTTASGLGRTMHVSVAPCPFPLPPKPDLPSPVPPFGMIVVRDLTAQRQQERVQSEFIVAAAHQLRTPLTSLKLSLGLLTQSLTGIANPQQERLVRNATLSTSRMERLANALIELTNIQSGRVRLQPGPVSVRTIIAQSVQMERDRLVRKEQQVYEDLPDEDLAVQVDAQSLRRVLGHLIANASKFSAAGKPIVVRVVPEGRNVVFSVHDEGIGIPTDEQDVIFETFYQGQVVENGAEAGSGLGLPLVRALVELNGGHIWCASTPGVGSTFFVRLPAATSINASTRQDEAKANMRQETPAAPVTRQK